MKRNRVLLRLALAVAAVSLVSTGIALGASSSGRSTSLTNRDAVYNSASISGTVKDAQGNPITSEDICVQAYEPTSYGGWSYSNSAVTNAQGQYTITGLPSGSYKIGFADCDQTEPYDAAYQSSTRDDVPQYYSDTGDWESASLVVLSEDGAKSGIDAELAVGTSISGHVYTSSDESSPKQSECVYAQEASDEFPVSGPLGDYSDEYGNASAGDGSYDLRHLEPGIDYVVEFYDCANPKRYLTQFDGDASTPQTATPLSPTLAHPVTGIDAHLTLGGEIRGSVTDSKAALITSSDICVYADRIYETHAPDANPDDDYAYTTSEAAGDYTLSGLSAGNYEVRFEDCDDAYSTRNDVAQYYKNQGIYSNATPVKVTLGGESTGIDAALAPGASISGHVYGSLDTSKPLEDVCVYAFSATESSLYPVEASYTYTGLDGSYSVKHLPPGEGYKLSFYDCSNQNYTMQYYNDVSTLTAASVLTPTLTEPITGIDAHLSNDTPETEITGGPADGAATNATSASFAFTSSITGSTFECELDSGAFASCSSPFATGTLASGRHTFTVRAKANGITDPDPATVTWTISPSSPTSTSQGSVPANGTVSSNPGAGASASTPVIAEATLPDAGTVTMTKEPATTPSENGYTVFGQQLDIAATAPGSTTPLQGTVAHPIALTFEIDGSEIPANTEPSTITVLRNGVPAPNCTGASGTAAPDPCVASRTPTPDGGLKLTVLTIHCSLWNFARTSSTPSNSNEPSGGASTTTSPPAPAASGGGAVQGTASTGVLGAQLSHSSAKLGHAGTAGPVATVPVQCSGAKGTTCKVELTLEVAETLKGGKLVGLAATASKSQKTREVILGTATVTLGAGETKTVKLALNATGRRLLTTRHLLKVKLSISEAAAASTGTAAGLTLTFRTKQKH